MYLEESESEPQNVALRKESVDRNSQLIGGVFFGRLSLSARRAWIEMSVGGSVAEVD